MKGEENIDKVFKDKLENHSVSPSDSVWDRIDSSLDSDRKKGFFIPRNLIWIAVLLITSSIAVFSILKVQELDKSVQVLNEKIQSKESQEKTAQSSRLASNGKDTEAIEEITSVSPETGNQFPVDKSETDQHLPQESSPPAVNKNHSESATPSEIKQVVEKVNSPSNDVEQSIVTATNSFSPAMSTSGKKEINLNELSLPELETFNPLAINTLTPDFKKRNPEFVHENRKLNSFKYSPWYVNVYWVGNINSSRMVTSENANTDESLMTNSQNTISQGIGIALSRKMGNNLRLSVGLEYSKWCRESKYDITYAAPNPDISSIPGTFTNESIVNSPAGEQLISFEGQPVYTGSEILTSGDSLDVQLKFKECFTTLSVPVSLEYQIHLKRFAILPGIGITYDRVLDKSIHIVDNPSDIDFNVKSVSDTKSDFFSYSLGLAVEYSLTEKLNIRASGVYKAWFTPIYENSSYSTFPTLYSARLGLMYRL